ncbi:unnamed protein product, partial [Amoebophrya sp. A25]
VKSVVPIWGPEESELATAWKQSTEEQKRRKQLRRTFQMNDGAERANYVKAAWGKPG